MAINLFIKKTGTLYGTVNLKDSNNHQNIDVYIPGSMTITKTDFNGHYLLAVPEGNYKLKFSKANYKDIILQNISVKSGQNTEIDPVVVEKNPDAHLYGTITGKISDGINVLSNALIFIQADITITDSEGNYCSGNILPGTYQMQVYKQGFKTKTLDITVGANKIIVLDVVLAGNYSN